MPYHPYYTKKILQKLHGDLANKIPDVPNDRLHLYELPLLGLNHIVKLLSCFPSVIPGKAVTSCLFHASMYLSSYLSIKPFSLSAHSRKFYLLNIILSKKLEHHIHLLANDKEKRLIVLNKKEIERCELVAHVVSYKQSVDYNIYLNDYFEPDIAARYCSYFDKHKDLVLAYELACKNFHLQSDSDDCFEKYCNARDAINANFPLYQKYKSEFVGYELRKHLDIHEEAACEFLVLDEIDYKIYAKYQLETYLDFIINDHDIDILLILCRFFIENFLDPEVAQRVFADTDLYLQHFSQLLNKVGQIGEVQDLISEFDLGDLDGYKDLLVDFISTDKIRANQHLLLLENLTIKCLQGVVELINTSDDTKVIVFNEILRQCRADFEKYTDEKINIFDDVIKFMLVKLSDRGTRILLHNFLAKFSSQHISAIEDLLAMYNKNKEENGLTKIACSRL